MTLAYVALGSNRGDRAAHLQQAVDGLAGAAGIEVVAVSRVYETDPVGGPPQEPYLNAVVAVETARAPRQLLTVCQRLEREAGREPDRGRRVRWGPRELDVDILLVGEERVDEPDLVVPHPRMHERAFVLAPLADVAPGLEVVEEARARFPDGWPGVRPVSVELVSERS